MQFSLSFLSLPQKYCFLRRPPSILSKNCKNTSLKKILMIREGKGKGKEKEKGKEKGKRRKQKDKGVNRVNS